MSENNKPVVPSSVRALRILWIVLHLLLPTYAVYWGMDQVYIEQGFEPHLGGAKGLFFLVLLLLLVMQILFYPSLPRRVSGMLSLLLGPLALNGLSAWLRGDMSLALYATECGIIYTLTPGLGFTGLVLFGGLYTGRKGPGFFKTLAQGIFIVPFIILAMAFVGYLHVVMYGNGELIELFALASFLLGLLFEAYYFFLKLIPLSIFGEKYEIS